MTKTTEPTTKILMTAVLLLAACGGGDEAVAPIPLDRVPAEVSKALCEKIYTCCSPAERMENSLTGTDAASCQAKLAAFPAFYLDFQVALAAGRAVYHGDRMATCLADLRAGSCDKIKATAGGADISKVCKGVFEPRVAPGGHCGAWWDCVDGWCAGDFGIDRDSCVARKPQGAVCDENAECSSNHCDMASCVPADEDATDLCKVGLGGD
jgi:hypothetical protein